MKRSQVSNGRKFQYLALAIGEVERTEDGVWKTDIIGLACQYSSNPKLKREDFEAILNTPIINVIEQVTKDKNIVKRTEETYDRCKIIEEYKSNIGKAVAKCSIGEQKENGKKFKSGNTVNTIKGVIMHEFIDEPAYIFEEDDSYVECRRCKIVETETK